MTLDECISILVEHNAWRRAEFPYNVWPPTKDSEYRISPKDLGEAIDFAITKLRERGSHDVGSIQKKI